MSATSEGKLRTTSLIVWSLNIGGARFRCLREESGFVCQVLNSSDWTPFSRSENAYGTLKTLVSSGLVESAVSDRVKECNTTT